MFKIEDSKWPGTAKLMEEMNELGEILCKLMGSNGKVKHWTGDLKLKMKDEVADVLAAITFFNDLNMNEDEQNYILERMKRKYETFWGWREDLNKKKDDV